mgnify:CR=1 FL=1
MNSDFIVKKSKSMKGNTLINTFIQNKKKIPSILINSKNGEIFNLKELNESNETKENNTDYKNTNLILKQKSLALSKTNKNFFKNKILSQNEIQKNPANFQKKSTTSTWKGVNEDAIIPLVQITYKGISKKADNFQKKVSKE